MAGCGELTFDKHILLSTTVYHSAEISTYNDVHDCVGAGYSILFNSVVRKHARATRGNEGRDRSESPCDPSQAQAIPCPEGEHHV